MAVLLFGGCYIGALEAQVRGSQANGRRALGYVDGEVCGLVDGLDESCVLLCSFLLGVLEEILHVIC